MCRGRYSGPVVVGGLGGSGTRVVAMLLSELGFYLGGDLNRAYDNLWFTLLFERPGWFAASSDEEIAKWLQVHEKAMTGYLRPQWSELRLILSAAVDLWSHWRIHIGRDRGVLPIRQVVKKVWPIRQVAVTAWLAKRVVTMACSRKYDLSGYIGWGWKTPSSSVYIKHLSEYFDGLKFIHVIRHGLDMAYSNNQANLEGWGSLFGVRMPDEPSLLPKASLHYWTKLNETTICLGERLLGDRFLVISYDELCLEPVEQIGKLIGFLELNEKEVNMGHLCSLVDAPPSLGRYRSGDLSVFTEDEIDAVRRLGFSVDVPVQFSKLT